MAKKRPKRRIPRYVYNDATPKFLSGPEPTAAADTVKQPGTIKAQLIGKLGSRGYGDLVAALRAQE